MISVARAKELVLLAAPTMPVESCSINAARGRVLAKDVLTSLQLPLFDNSAMDGYAVRSEDTSGADDSNVVELKRTGESAAGAPDSGDILGSMECRRIFTGAPMPPGADAVIRQEDVVVANGVIQIQQSVGRGSNIRYAGEELKIGDVVLEKGEQLTPAGIGILASMGVKDVEVYCRPRVGIIVTGSEIVDDIADLHPGKIFDSNSHVLAAALEQMGVPLVLRSSCKDDREILGAAILDGLAQVDVLLVTGGVSVGDYDYVKELAAQAGVGELFWRVKQKPGKPLFVGTAEEGKKMFFGMPGNPASVLVSFYEYVRPALLMAMGKRESGPATTMAKLVKSYRKGAGLTHFLKGNLREDGSVNILQNQGSHTMSSFAKANCLVIIPEEITEIEEGELVEVHLLPQ